MPYIPADVVSRAKQMDLYTYLRSYEPQELIHLGGAWAYRLSENHFRLLYFRPADMKQLMMQTEEWLRRRIRAVIWKQWKLVRARHKMLQRL